LRLLDQAIPWKKSGLLWRACGPIRVTSPSSSDSTSVYFIGLGGSGMLPLARLARARGYRVRGSDAKLTESSIQSLQEEGLEAFAEPDPDRINDDLVVYSTAISPEHPERQKGGELQDQGKARLLHRMDFLNTLVEHCEIRLGMAGTHGKTSSTALAGWLLLELDMEPLIIAGGRPLYLERAIRNGHRIAVFETDESDGSFLKSNATHRLILNADEDHLNYYGSFENLQKAFAEFAGQGLAIYNAGDPGLAPLKLKYASDASMRDASGSDASSSAPRTGAYEILKNREQCLASDSFLAGYFPNDDDTLHFRIRADGAYQGTRSAGPASGDNGSVTESAQQFYSFRLGVPGRHFASNALGILALLLKAFPDLDLNRCLQAMASFPGTERRLELLGEYQGIPVYDDYGHHPSEIRAVLDALRQRFPGQEVHVVFQPHRYTRTQELAPAFAESLLHADKVFLLPLYSAGEAPLEGVDSALIARHMPADRPATLLVGDDFSPVFANAPEAGNDRESLPEAMDAARERSADESGIHPGNASDRPIVLFLGAGDVSQKARQLFE
tara:strand:+ start:1450 stop:3123 length:1674 start_codon:yes stop_codon:yes gene_type:complete